MRIADVSSHQDFEVKPITQPNLHASFIHLIESDKDGFSCVALDEECLAVARINAKINIYSITNSGNAKLMLTILGHSSPVYAMLIHDKLLFTGESIEDALIKVWELRTGTLVRALKGHTYPIMSISAFSRQLIASASSDRTVRVWQLESSDEIVTVLSHEYPVLAVCMVSKEVLISGGDDCFLIVWKWVSKQKLHTLLSHNNSLSFIVQRREEIVTGGGDGCLKVYARQDFLKEGQTSIEEKVHLEVSTEALHHAACFEDRVVVSDMENGVFLLKLSDKKHSRVQMDLPYYERMRGLALVAPDLLLTINSSLKLWQLETGNTSGAGTNMELIMEEI